MAADLDHARTIKDQLVVSLRSSPEVNGVGLVRTDAGWAVKVNLTRPAPDLGLPGEMDGVRITVDVVGPIATQ